MTMTTGSERVLIVDDGPVDACIVTMCNLSVSVPCHHPPFSQARMTTT